MQAKDIEKLDLSRAETRDIVTPYAFKIDQALLGLPLASPARRALAIIIDVTLIFLAAKISAAIIAFFAALAFYRGTAQKHLPAMSTIGRRALKFTAASFLFVSSLLLLSFAIDYLEGNNGADSESQSLAFNVAEKQLIKDYLLEGETQQACDESCEVARLAQLIADVPKLNDLVDTDNVGMSQILLLGFVELTDTQQHAPFETQYETTQKPNSILAWGKGIIEDLGLGFGWAAIYFTLFSLLWNGQTPGKKLCNIRVVLLKGGKLNLFDSFVRYGGYGAGFATGLLGFFQIYWDPNRQAIQDKISATVVIKGSVDQIVNEETIEKAVHD
ncbi:RDD family protein [Pseudoalteromonas sp. MMG010]|uniref:RDD family protein n=1 Tax=Pseudoalteromonas sp. MMG010 TaxID=2822685 RepID=UPI001B39FB69|nr:RDD family protein [Pseudoalteromonas sp. MMG010]MBQ4834511.1 RDD family protein [Pseudoalteromonas sp. MMG010]